MQLLNLLKTIISKFRNIMAETNSCPRYTTIKIYKNLVPAIFVIFLIVYFRIRHALRSGASLRSAC